MKCMHIMEYYLAKKEKKQSDFTIYNMEALWKE